MKIVRKSLIIAIPLLSMIAGAILGARYLQSDRFQEYVRSTLISKLENATGLDCKINSLQVDVLRGKFVMRGIELSQRKAATGLVHMTVPQISASLSISSVWHLRVRLHELRIVRPRLELVSGNGESSWSPEEILQDLKISLRLEAAKVSVEDGWIRLNRNTAPFNVSIDDFDLGVSYEKKLPSYRVRLVYARSRLFWENRDIVHGLELNAHVSLDGITIESLRFRRSGVGMNTILSGSGSFMNWKSPAFRLHLTGTLDARDLALTTPTLYEGKGNIEVIADLQSDRNGIFSKGKFSAKAGSYRKMGFRNLAGIFEIQNDVLHLRNSTARIGDGTVLANAEIQLVGSSKEPNRVTISARNVPVVEVGRLLNLPLLTFENGADSSTLLTWHSQGELRADCDVTLHRAARQNWTSTQSTPLDGNVRFTYFESGTLILQSANLSSPSTSFQASVGQGPQFHVQLSTTRIAEPFDLIANFSEAVVAFIKRIPDVREMEGSFAFNGDVRIQSSSDVEYKGSATARNGKWRSYRVETLTMEALFRPPLLELRPISLHSGSQLVDGALDLDLGDGERISSFGFKGNIHQLGIASLKDFGVDVSHLSGLLSGSGSIRFAHDAWQGDGQFFIEKGSYQSEPFDRVRMHLSLDNQRLRILNSEVLRDGARLSAEGQLDLASRKIDGSAQLQGLSLEEIPAVKKRGGTVRGRIGGGGTIGGTMDSPAFSGDFELASLRYGTLNIGNGKGHVDFKDGSVRANARIKSELGNLGFQTEIAVRSGYPGKTAMEFEHLDIQKIISEKPPAYLQDISTALEGKLEAEGNFEDLASLRIRGEVDGAHFKIHDHEVHNDGRMRFTIVNQDLRIESVRFVGEGSNISLSGTIPLNDGPSLDLNFNGNLNLELLEGFEKKLRSEGSATLSIRASGRKSEPQIIGQASFRDAKIDHEALPFRLSSMQGDIVFSRNLIRFENVRGSAASGSIQISGTIEHRNAVLRSINLAIAMRNARLPYPKDFRSVGNADLVLSGTADSQMLSGEIDLTRIEYVRSFNLLEQLASRSPVQTGPLTTEPYLLGLRLNIEIRSNNGLSIDNELTRLRGSMRLMLRGTPAYPSLTGHVEAGEGMIFFRGSRFEISHAAADFVDRNRINPVLEIRAEADVKTYRLILDAVGDLEHLNLNISSDPPMSTVDILSLLTTGKTETAGTTSTGTGTVTSQRESQMAGMSAASVLSENLTGVLGKRVQRIFGLESFRVDPFLAGAENDPTARITISERLSKDLVVTFSRNLTTNQEQIVVIEYDVGKNVSVVATRDEDGKFGLDFRFRKRLR